MVTELFRFSDVSCAFLELENIQSVHPMFLSFAGKYDIGLKEICEVGQ